MLSVPPEARARGSRKGPETNGFTPEELNFTVGGAHRCLPQAGGPGPTDVGTDALVTHQKVKLWPARPALVVRKNSGNKAVLLNSMKVEAMNSSGSRSRRL